MDIILNFIKTDIFFIIILIINIILLLLYITNAIRLKNLRKSYMIFMNKIGKGENIQENIEKYMAKIKEVEIKNEELLNYCKTLDNNIANCIQKIGIVRYSAFKDTGSDLSFTLALLNEENSGVVLNGIYSQDMSNIYAKPVEKGESKYTLSAEEKEAIKKAIN